MLRDTLVHKVLKIPHTLHVGVDQPGEDPGEPTIVFVHGLARSHKVWSYLIAELPPQARIVAVDLLGFGESPRPEWHSYNATEQAICLHATLRRIGVHGKVKLVGHSLGALVAIEYTKLHPGRVDSLVLCSTPLYKSEPRLLLNKFQLPDGSTVRMRMVKNLRGNVALMKKLNYYARRVSFIDNDFIVDDKNLLTVTRSLEMAIENQSAFEWLMTTDIKTSLVYGLLDPYVINKYYRALARHNTHCKVYPVAAAHEVNRNKAYAKQVKKLLFADHS